jgi:hypothetical protein
MLTDLLNLLLNCTELQPGLVLSHTVHTKLFHSIGDTLLHSGDIVIEFSLNNCIFEVDLVLIADSLLNLLDQFSVGFWDLIYSHAPVCIII